MNANSQSMPRLLALAPVIPVLVLDDVPEAVEAARALVDGGLRVLEVTLRTPKALAVIACLAEAIPDAVVGAGTVTTPAQLEAAARAGASFAVSPGLYPALAAAAADSPLPLLPGVATASEAMAAREAGFTCLKLFPAQQVGGAALLRALHGPLPELRFCPTGGISAANAGDYLALPNVACVGGSWVLPDAARQAGDWVTVRRLAQEAAALRAGAL